MSRWLLMLLLLHHIEGVCKPFSALSRLVMGFVDQALGRDRQAATERVQGRQAPEPQADAAQRVSGEQAAAIERARQTGRQRQDRPAVQRRQQPPRPVRGAVEPPRPAPDWAEQVRQYEQQEG